MGKGNKGGGSPSRPYRGGHTGRGGSHEKGGCLAAVVAIAIVGAGVQTAAGAAIGSLIS